MNSLPNFSGQNFEEQPKLDEAIINRLIPPSTLSIEDIQKRYPPRVLQPGQMVTRIAPSPTGFMHVGTLYTALISERLAHQTNGVFFLRIEDTDKKREVVGAASSVIESLEHYGVKVDEGPTSSGEDKGLYGPYTQSERTDLYQTFARLLLEKGVAYPCFCSPEEIEEMRTMQEKGKIRPGYYGDWAKWRNASSEKVQSALDEGKPYVIRFQSRGGVENKVVVTDLLKGKRDVAENDQDIVLIKSDGTPTYHLAHIVDDHFMGTTHVIRGDEWFSSLSLHLQLFNSLGWEPPAYGHLAPIQKMEGSSKRKLSKRKDPEANVLYYDEQGYPQEALIEYLLNLANSNFEDWRKEHIDMPNVNFNLSLERLANSNGALFDFSKLNDISKEFIARLADIFDPTLRWADQYNKELALLMKEHSEYVRKILQIERAGDTVRKDIAKWSDVQHEIAYFFDPIENKSGELLANFDKGEITRVIDKFLSTFDMQDTKEVWLAKIRSACAELGYAENHKMLKADPSKYKGSIADVTRIIRVLLTGRAQTPDLYQIMQVMGHELVVKRLKAAA